MLHAGEIQIRLVRSREHAQLRRARLSALACAPHLAEYLAKEAAAPSAFWRDRASRSASATTMATFVAVEQHAFVGIVDGFLAQGRGTVEIGGMWVSPHWRRAGIGRELLSAIVAWARDQGATRAALWVMAANEPARTLYEQDGFELTETSGAGLRLEKTIQPLPITSAGRPSPSREVVPSPVAPNSQACANTSDQPSALTLDLSYSLHDV